jgi:hypothetical protein
MFQKFLSPDGTSGGGAGTEQQVPPAPVSQNQPATGETAEQKLAEALAEASRWQNGYGGLQKTIAKKDLEIGDLTKAKDADHSALEALQITHTALQTEHQTAKAKLDELELGKTTAEVKLMRAKIIMSKFPELASWEADGQLPETPADAKETDVEALFKSFSEKLTAAAKGITKTAGASIVPPPGGDPAGTNAAEELKLAKAAMSKGKIDEYTLHYNKYLELSAKKS